MNGSFAIYRLPHGKSCTLMRQRHGKPLCLSSCRSLMDVEGFVFAPFAVSASNPLFVLQPDTVEDMLLPDVDDIDCGMPECADATGERALYGTDFRCFHEELISGRFSKIVLARRHDMECRNDIQPMALFRKACRMYPRMFVALVSIPQAGTWLMATPEILLEGRGRNWHTMALAGTVRLSGKLLAFDCPVGSTAGNADIHWSEKNIEEQRIVARYISECLGRHADEIEESGPYTARAGNVVHLRSDFNFVLREDAGIGELIDDLHPTPAVCGLPKTEAFDFIGMNEHCSRSFYSGFVGPMFNDRDSSLFVSLRCMSMNGGRYSLYAGGGLLPDSDEQQEWEETEAKIETMKALFEGAKEARDRS